MKVVSWKSVVHFPPHCGTTTLRYYDTTTLPLKGVEKLCFFPNGDVPMGSRWCNPAFGAVLDVVKRGRRGRGMEYIVDYGTGCAVCCVRCLRCLCCLRCLRCLRSLLSEWDYLNLENEAGKGICITFSGPVVCDVGVNELVYPNWDIIQGGYPDWGTDVDMT